MLTIVGKSRATLGGGGGSSPAKRLVVIAGQSNALGLAVASSISNYPDIDDAYAAVQYIEKSATLNDPPSFTTDGPRDLAPRTKTVAGQVAGTCGVELSMGRDLDAAGGGTWFVAKMAIDGSGLEDEWVNASYPSSGTPLYDQFETFISDQLTAWEAELGAIVWIQGEADSNESPDAANYLTNEETLFGDLRTTFGATVPIVIVRLNSNYTAGGSVPTIRSHQESYAAKHSNVAIVAADDLPFRDTAHYTDDAYSTLGSRIADKIIDLTNGTTPANPYWMAAGIPSVAAAVGSPTPTQPAHQSGDIQILAIAGIGANSITLTDAQGFTEVTGSPFRDSGSSLNARLHVFWRRCTSSSMTAPTIGDPASDDAKMALIFTIRGAVASGDPVDVIAGDGATTSTSVTIPGATTTGANRLIVNILAHEVDAATPQASGWANADLTELTEQFDVSYTTGSGIGLAIATGVKATAGAYGSTTATLATTSTQARVSIAIKP